MKKIISLTIAFVIILCLAGCGSAVPTMNAGGEENIEKEIPESMDASDVADMLESGMTVDEVIDRVEEVKSGESATTDKPAETASPTQAPASTPAPTAKPTPEPTETPKTPEPTPTPHVHQYKVESSTEATCSTEGSVVKVCECGERQTENVPATGQHNWVEGSVVVHHEALGHVEQRETQVQTGSHKYQVYECALCGFQSDTASGVTDHRAEYAAQGVRHTGSTLIYDYEEPVYETRTENVWIVDKDPWDEVVGSGTYTCSNCGTTK